jgi:hypothetical protein
MIENSSRVYGTIAEEEVRPGARLKLLRKRALSLAHR